MEEMTEANKYPFLYKALGSNLELKKTVFKEHNPEYLKYLDYLIAELYQNSCGRLDIKLSETSSKSDKFQALISELEFARYFCRRKMLIQFLSDHAFQGRKVPDIHVINGSKEYFIEVKNIQQDDLDFILGLRIADLLNSRSLSYAVVVSSSPHVSTPTYRYQTRDKKEQYVEVAFTEFVNKLDSYRNGQIPNTIETNYVDVELHKTSKGRSYLGIGTMKEAISQAPDYKERIRFDILKKAEKRNEWIGDELDKYFIVAIDDNALAFSIDNYNVEFFGHATTYLSGKVPRVNMSYDIEDAVKSGWEKYLITMCILPNKITVIPTDRRGLCLTDPLTKNITAILVRNRERFYLLANPFADPRINYSEILQDFKDCYIGWEP
jgi:hypothetical protein